MNAHRAHRRRFPRAFTFVELIVVVAIVGILAALAVPRFSGAGERYRVRLAADRVVREINYARSRAISLGAQQTITFTPNAPSLTIVGMPNPDAPAQTYSVPLSAEPYRMRRLSADFDGASSLTFNGFGVPSAAGKVTVQSGRTAVTVIVSAGLGVCTIDSLDANATPVAD